jgi:hypothetical protein
MDQIVKKYILDIRFLGFLCLRATVETVAMLQVGTACFSCNSPDLDSSKLIILTNRLGHQGNSDIKKPLRVTACA